MCGGLRLWAQEKADKAEMCGLEQGRREGELAGEIAGQKMIIKRMVENNMPLEKIAELIGFPVEKVKEILKTEKVYH